MATRRLLATVSLAAWSLAAGGAWARCNSISVSVDGTADPGVADALVRVDVHPAAPQGGDSILVRPDAEGRFSASLWYSTSANGPVGSLFGDDCTRRPMEVVVSLQSGERTVGTARLDVPSQFARDVLGNYRAKGRVTLRPDGRRGSD
jgi:hypothetical protein